MPPLDTRRGGAALAEAAPPRPISSGLILLFAVATGAVAANLYYAQPLVGLIGPAVGLSPHAASLLVTLTQLGYGAGLILLVPVGDLLENRRLVGITLCFTVAALLMAAVAQSAWTFLLASLLIGVTSSAAQMLVPIAAHLAPAESRGRVVGKVMSGLLLGILLARPIASILADTLGWRSVFVLSAVAMAGLVALLMRQLPHRQPVDGPRYGAMLRSMVRLALTTPILQRRSAYHAPLFAAFSLFWTAAPLELAGPDFGLTQRGIALFALAGAAGAVAAPLAGHAADRGWGRPATLFAILAVAAAFALGHFEGTRSVYVLAAAGIVLDFGVQTNLVVGQRAIFALAPAIRSRLNGLYMASFFVGGAIGSALASPAYQSGGWRLVSWIGIALPLLSLLAFLTEFITPPAAGRGRAG
jgi:predicted MFS family arabinose efflux permease